MKQNKINRNAAGVLQRAVKRIDSQEYYGKKGVKLVLISDVELSGENEVLSARKLQAAIKE